MPKPNLFPKFNLSETMANPTLISNLILSKTNTGPQEKNGPNVFWGEYSAVTFI